jgi:hypothetical protein
MPGQGTLPGKFVYDGAQTKSQERADAVLPANTLDTLIIFSNSLPLLPSAELAFDDCGQKPYTC